MKNNYNYYQDVKAGSGNVQKTDNLAFLDHWFQWKLDFAAEEVSLE